MGGLFCEQFGFEVAMDFLWLLVNAVMAAIVPSGTRVVRRVDDAR